CERGRCAPATFGVGVAPPHEEPRRGSSSSAHESTSGGSTNYGSGHPIPVLRPSFMTSPYQRPSFPFGLIPNSTLFITWSPEMITRMELQPSLPYRHQST